MAATMDLAVASITDIAVGIRGIRLAHPDGSALPTVVPGAHVDLHLGNGLMRSYSLCHEPGAATWLVAVKREPASRGGSAFLHDVLKPGDRLKVGSPRNVLNPAAGNGSHLLLAGGIGITPLIAIARYLESSGAVWALHYFARSHAEAAFADNLAAGPLAGRTSFHFGLDPAGVPARLETLLRTPDGRDHLYLCGPTPFMQAVHSAAAGWTSAQIHEEYFVAEPISDTGGDRPFEVALARSGRSIIVPSDRSILETLHANGIEAEHSCEQGICGACMTAVIEGTPDHRDRFLTDDERHSAAWIMPCVSRAAGGRLVLDL